MKTLCLELGFNLLKHILLMAKVTNSTHDANVWGIKFGMIHINVLGPTRMLRNVVPFVNCILLNNVLI